MCFSDIQTHERGAKVTGGKEFTSLWTWEGFLELEGYHVPGPLQLHAANASKALWDGVPGTPVAWLKSARQATRRSPPFLEPLGSSPNNNPCTREGCARTAFLSRWRPGRGPLTFRLRGLDDAASFSSTRAGAGPPSGPQPEGQHWLLLP